MRNPKLNLKEVIQYLSYTQEVIGQLVDRRGIENKEAIADARKGSEALEVSIDYLKLAYALLEKDENKKREEESKE